MLASVLSTPIKSNHREVELIGKIFGKLTVIAFAEFKSNGAHWLCRCECGKTKIVGGGTMKNGHSRSCGCLKKTNKITIAGDEATLEMKRGICVIDSADVHLVSPFTWCAQKRHRTSYVVTHINNKTVYMHSLIMGTVGSRAEGKTVDHVDCDGMNNRRSNLRICSIMENSRNQQKRFGQRSRFKGVGLDTRDGKWQSRIKVNYHTQNLGRFDSEVEAARAYNEAAIRLFGQFALLNVIESS